MQAYDIFMLIVLVGAVVWGAWKGLAWQIASIGSIVASYFVALAFRQPLSQLINASPPWNIFISMLILFLGTGLVVWIGFNLISEFIEKVKLKEFDRQIGALFGFAKGVLLCVLITLFSVTLLSEPQRQAICNSKSGYYIAILLDKADAVIPGEVHQVLDPYIDRLDKEIAHPHSGPTTGPTTAPSGDTWQWAKNLFSAGGIFGKSDPNSAAPTGGVPASIPSLPNFPESFPTGGDIIRAQPAGGSFDPQMADRPGIPTTPRAPSSDLRRW